MKKIFTPADILIPENEHINRWSVIACDQFSSQPEYWERVRLSAEGYPSALNLIIPEAYLGQTDEQEQAEKISSAMENYLNNGVFREIKDSFIYIERTLPCGHVRKGIAGAIDLEEYDYTGRSAAIRASEGTILERLPARINIRKNACLELPHIIAFINDKQNTVIEPLAEKAELLPDVYDFTLMEGGGHIKGKAVTGDACVGVIKAINALYEKNDLLMIIGDGNHSLAAAKEYWNELKPGLSDDEKENHPARRALVEVCNVYDPAIDFMAIHRVLFSIDAPAFIREFEDNMPSGDDYVLQWITKEKRGQTGIKAACIGDMLEAVQDFIDEYVRKSPDSTIDYIHGADATQTLAQSENCLGLILPAMDKSELFDTVAMRGVFPRKSFSVGHAIDKRYYLECRRII